MKVTVSIINYNYGRYLREAINSALDQVAPGVDLDVLVVDDGSTDGSDRVIESFKCEPRVFCSKTENRGFGASLTRAISEAKGEFIFLLDADDYFLSSKIGKVSPYLRQGALYVSHPCRLVDDRGTPIGPGGHGSTSTVAVSKRAAQDLFPLENELSLHAIWRMGRGVVLTEQLTVYRVHAASMTNRREAGKWNNYLASVHRGLADRINALASGDNAPTWFAPRPAALKEAMALTSQAFYHELEAALELGKITKAWRACFLMLWWAFKARSSISRWHLKRVLRTVVMRPTAPKRT